MKQKEALLNLLESLHELYEALAACTVRLIITEVKRAPLNVTVMLIKLVAQ